VSPVWTKAVLAPAVATASTGNPVWRTTVHVAPPLRVSSTSPGQRSWHAAVATLPATSPSFALQKADASGANPRPSAGTATGGVLPANTGETLTAGPQFGSRAVARTCPAMPVRVSV
jgi:hypothetical protein